MARARTRRRRKGSPWKGTIRLVIVFGVLLAVNAYFFAFRRGTSVPALKRLSESHEPVAIASPQRARAIDAAGKVEPLSMTARLATGRTTAAGAARANEINDAGRLESGTLVAGDTLPSVLLRAGVPAGTISAVASALATRFDVLRLRAGHEYLIRFDAEDRLRAVELRIAPDVLYLVERGPARGEGFRASREAGPLTIELGAVGGTLAGSLEDGVRRAGEGPPLAAQLADALAADASLDATAAPGDRFKVVVEKLYIGDRFWRYGRLLAFELTQSGAVAARSFWFQTEPGAGGYFAASGDAMGKSPLHSPLRYARLPPGYDGKRMRPVLHTEQAHLGVDWGAPAGTPVIATAAGTVAYVGSRSGKGERVVIAHPGGMETSYAHLGSFARGLEEGQSVRQRQVIGYVGATGLPPGAAAHLHYGVRMGGHFVDPLRLKPVRDAPVPPAMRDRFAAVIAPLEQLLAGVPSDAPRPTRASGR